MNRERHLVSNDLALSTLSTLSTIRRATLFACSLLGFCHATSAETTFYGSPRVALAGLFDRGDVDCWDVSPTGSRWGVVGSEDLGGGLAQIYAVEIGPGGGLGASTPFGTSAQSAGQDPDIVYLESPSVQAFAKLLGAKLAPGSDAVVIDGVSGSEEPVNPGEGFEASISFAWARDAASGMLAYSDSVDPTGAGTNGAIVGHTYGYTSPGGVNIELAFRINDFVDGTTSSPDLSFLLIDFRGPSSPAFVAVWQSSASPGSDNQALSIQGRLFDIAGTPLGPQFQVNTLGSGLQMNPQVAAARDGSGFLVVWQSEVSAGPDTSLTSIQGQLFDSTGAAVGDQFQVNQDAPGFQYEPSIDSLQDGDYVVVWADLDQTATTSTVVGRFVSASGVPLGEDLEISTGSASSEPFPEVAACGNEVVAVWTGPEGILVRGSFGFLFADGFESGDLASWSSSVP